MYEKITLDNLNENSVSVKTQQCTTIDGKEYALGEPHRRSYVNSTSGREKVTTELPQAQRDAIFAIWGSTPTVTETL